MFPLVASGMNGATRVFVCFLSVLQPFRAPTHRIFCELDLFSCLADASYHASEAAFSFFVVTEAPLLNYCAYEAIPATFITSFFPYSLKYV
jgi:hypothetical protein